MKKNISFLFLLFALIVGFTQPTFAQANEKSPVPILSIEGNGSAITVPDQAALTIGVTTQAPTAQQAQSKNAAASSAIQNALLAQGIAKDCIQTRNYAFSPTYSNVKNHENEINGYSVDNTITVLVNDINQTGKIIDLALHHGATNINSLNFSVRSTSKLRKDALTAAIRDARDKADIMANALGKRIVGIQTVSENQTSLQTRNFDQLMLAKATMATPIQPGNVNFSASVHIDFILSE